jgi:hypothetical protein
MKNIVVISYLAFLYSAIVTIIALIFFEEYAVWTLLGAATAMFNHSLLVKFSKNKMTKELSYLLIAFKLIIYLIVLGFMFFDMRDNNQLLMWSYIFFLIGAFNIKVGIIIYHLPFKTFIKMREEVDEVKEEGEDIDGSIS